MRPRSILCVCLLAASGLLGCSRNPSNIPTSEAPAVPVSHPVQREVTDYIDFTGRIYAVQAVEIRARATGYLVQTPFKEGAEVHKGDLLFEIDPRPYEAQFEQARSQVTLSEASLRLARTTYERDRPLAASGAVTKQQLDQDEAAVAEAEARVKASQASLEITKLALSFTKVTSPIDGQVSGYYLTVGNLVTQDQTLLSTVVSLDPMYVYFDVDESTLLQVRRAINEGRITPYEEGKIPVLMALQNEADYAHKGTINFVNNQVNPTTGSIPVRGVFDNPRGILPATVASAIGQATNPGALWQAGWLGETLSRGGIRLMTPGMFVRIHLPIGKPHPALLVIDRAIASDQGRKYVYVLDSANKAQYKQITTGALQEDGLRVVEGLSPDDWVVSGGLQRVSPRLEIRPDRVPMPTLGSQGSAVRDQGSEAGGH
jgi:multidrug efflux system membrane fusion protein